MSEVGEWGDNREERKRRQGGVVLLARFTRVCPARGREEGGRCQLSCKVRKYVITHTETAIMVMLASYESSQHCAGVVTTCLWLITVEVGIHLGGREFKLW